MGKSRSQGGTTRKAKSKAREQSMTGRYGKSIEGNSMGLASIPEKPGTLASMMPTATSTANSQSQSSSGAGMAVKNHSDLVELWRDLAKSLSFSADRLRGNAKLLMDSIDMLSASAEIMRVTLPGFCKARDSLSIPSQENERARDTRHIPSMTEAAESDVEKAVGTLLAAKASIANSALALSDFSPILEELMSGMQRHPLTINITEPPPV